jgi:superoxide dismutase, Cu-Zn family
VVVRTHLIHRNLAAMVKKLLVWAPLIWLVGCSMTAPGPRAAAELKDKDGKTVGRVFFRQAPDGVFVRLEVRGLAPGLHAVHIHAVAKCEGPAFTSAGDHFNPTQRKHGLKNPDGAHAGDLTNMLVAKNGFGRFESLTDAITLNAGPTSVFDADGSALVIHEGVDDYVTDPAGNAGDRVACGLIVPN